MAIEDNAIQEFIASIKPQEYGTVNRSSAVVSHVDDEGVVWVNVAGSVIETPTASTSSEVNAGDSVTVEWRSNKLYIVGNASNPSAGGQRVNAVEQSALEAGQLATEASVSASIARTAADSAVASADEAARAASDADEHAAAAETSAKAAGDSALQAINNAIRAQTSADAAQADATSARNSADAALFNLSVVEDVVGVLDLVSKNGTYAATNDEVPNPDKWYFERTGDGSEQSPYEYAVKSSPESTYHLTSDTSIDSTKTYYLRSGTGDIIYSLTEDETVVEGKTYYTRSGSGTAQDPYVYTIVAEPVDEDLGTYYEAVYDPYVYTEVETPSASELSTYYEKYYELTGINDAIRNYVSSHLVVDQNGVWLKQDNSDAMLQLTTTGVKVYNENGHVIAEYGTETVIGDKSGFHIRMGVNDQSGELGFYQGDNKVAYINNNKLYINQSVVVEQMDIGEPYDGIKSFGQWSWKLHKNSQGKNNLNLKWIG